MGLEKTKLPPTTPHHPILQMKKLQEQQKKKLSLKFLFPLNVRKFCNSL